MATKTKVPTTKEKKSAPSKAQMVRTANGEKARKDAIEEIGKRIDAIGTTAAELSEQQPATGKPAQEAAQPPDVRVGGPEEAGATTSLPLVKTTPRRRRAKDTGKADKQRKREKPKHLGGLDAAAQVLAEAGKPMSCSEIVDVMLERKLWTTTGKTPHATIYAGIIREVAAKGRESRFRKTGRGMFEVTGVTKGGNA